MIRWKNDSTIRYTNKVDPTRNSNTVDTGVT